MINIFIGQLNFSKTGPVMLGGPKGQPVTPNRLETDRYGTPRICTFLDPLASIGIGLFRGVLKFSSHTKSYTVKKTMTATQRSIPIHADKLWSLAWRNPFVRVLDSLMNYYFQPMALSWRLKSLPGVPGSLQFDSPLKISENLIPPLERERERAHIHNTERKGKIGQIT